jgi:plastocyanin
MGPDPICTQMHGAERVVQPVVLVGASGGLANVFVTLEGSFAAAPVATAPVTLDQRGCVYAPRVIGARVGQTLEVRNSDSLLHVVHGVSATRNGFTVTQPGGGVPQRLPLKDPELMLRLQCDVHPWMTAYVGVVTHPYFTVSRDDGSFEIGGVPAGPRTLRFWHERFGELTRPVRVGAGATSVIDVPFDAAAPVAPVSGAKSK